MHESSGGTLALSGVRLLPRGPLGFSELRNPIARASGSDRNNQICPRNDSRINKPVKRQAEGRAGDCVPDNE